MPARSAQNVSLTPELQKLIADKVATGHYRSASEYEALSVDTGRISLDWAVAGGRFNLRWRERGGPPVVKPSRTGFGTRLIERGLSAELRGRATIDYHPVGVVCTIEAPVEAMQDSAS